MSNSNTLDFSKFSHITPPSREAERVEVERRSEGLKAIRSIMENLINAMHAYYTDLAQLDSKARILEQKEQNIYEFDKQVRYEALQLEKNTLSFKQEKEYIDEKNRELKEKELKIGEDKAYLEELRIQTQEVKKAQDELMIKEKTIDDKLKLFSTLGEREKELTKKQEVIDQAIEIDKERKLLLDKREEKILAREARLARLENEAKIGYME